MTAREFDRRYIDEGDHHQEAVDKLALKSENAGSPGLGGMGVDPRSERRAPAVKRARVIKESLNCAATRASNTGSPR